MRDAPTVKDLVLIGGGRWAAQGAALWLLKDRIDRRWMRQYQELPAQRAGAPPPDHANAARQPGAV